MVEEEEHIFSYKNQNDTVFLPGFDTDDRRNDES